MSPSLMVRSFQRQPLGWLTGSLALSCAVMLVALTKPWDPSVAESLAKAAEAGRPPPVQACMDLTLWWAALAGLVVFGIALVMGKWWTGRSSAVLPPPGTVKRPVLITLLVLVAAGGAMRLPLMFHSFWNDEEVTMQDYSWGKWRADKRGDYRFRPAEWQDTVFYNRGGSNHPLNSALTRITLETAAKFHSKPSGRFSEPVARLIPFLASLGTLFLLGWLLSRWGWPVAGLAAVAVLAFNPWHIRYSVEIRGYSVMMLTALGSLGFLFAALASGKRRHWAGFALCQSAYVLAFAGSIYVAAAINGVTALWLLRSAATRPLILRLGVWSALSSVPVAFLIAPSLPQFAHYLEHGKRLISFGPGWEMDYLSHLVAGIQVHDHHPGASRALTLDQLGTPAREFLVWAVPLLALAGLARAVWNPSDPRLRLAAIILTLAPLLSYTHNKLADNPTFPWYLQYSTLALALGLGAWVQSRRLIHVAAASCLVILPYVVFAFPVGRHLGQVPRQPIRETAAILRGTAPTFGTLGETDTLTATFGTSDKRILTYDPRALQLRQPDDLDKLIARARAENVPLRVAFCGRQRLLTLPEDALERRWFDTLENPANGFHKTHNVQGMEELFSYHVFELTPPATPASPTESP